jgi:hypothetical protein
LGNDFESASLVGCPLFHARMPAGAHARARVSEKAATAVMYAQSLDARHARETGVVSREPVARAVGTRRAAEAEAKRGGRGGDDGAGGERRMCW